MSLAAVTARQWRYCAWQIIDSCPSTMDKFFVVPKGLVVPNGYGGHFWTACLDRAWLVVVGFVFACLGLGCPGLGCLVGLGVWVLGGCGNRVAGGTGWLVDERSEPPDSGFGLAWLLGVWLGCLAWVSGTECLGTGCLGLGWLWGQGGWWTSVASPQLLGFWLVGLRTGCLVGLGKA